MKHMHGSFVHDHVGGEIPHDHPPPGSEPRSGNGGWLGAACVLAVIGAAVFFLLGRNYGLCQSVLVASDTANDTACGTATTMHFLGIVIWVFAAVCLLAGLTRR
jgi:hypothetical protein